MARPALVTPLLWSGLGASLSCGWAAQVLLLARPAVFTGPWFRQGVLLAALHLTTLGFVGLMILGVLTQFLPMLLGKGLGSTAWAGTALGLFGLGLLVLLGVFLGWRSPGPALAAGACLLAGAALILVLAWPALAVRVRAQRLCRATLASSLAYLVATAGLGTLMAQGLVGPPRVSADPLALIRLHAHLGLFGFGCLTVFAVSYALLPMFNLAQGWSQWPGWAALGSAHLGLGLSAAHAFWAIPGLGPAAEAVLALAAAFYLLQVGLLWRHAVRRKADASVWLFRWACVALAVAAFSACVLERQAEPAPAAVKATAYVLLFGFLGGAIASQLLKIVPLMSWVDRFSALAGKAQIPVAGTLLDVRLAWAALPLHVLALGFGAWGLAWSSPLCLRVSGGLGAALFLDLGGMVLASRRRGEARPLAALFPTAAGLGAVPAPIPGPAPARIPV